MNRSRYRFEARWVDERGRWRKKKCVSDSDLPPSFHQSWYQSKALLYAISYSALEAAMKEMECVE